MLDTTASMAQYRGDGGRSVFPIPFPFLEASHIHAHIHDGAGRTRSLAAGVDYSVNRVSGANGELVLLGENLPREHVLTIRRLLPLTQEIFFHNQGPNSPRAMEEAADRLTMIAQQLQAELERCVSAPDPEAAAALSESAAAAAVRVAAVEAALEAKAEKRHGHEPGEVPGFAAALAAKADADAVARALAGKADAAELSAKADRSELALKADKAALAAKADMALVTAKADTVHGHALGDIAGLSAALDDKLDVDDPRLETLSSERGGTADHALLSNRDAADQHPQSAIRNLAADLGAIRSSLSELALADSSLGVRLDGKAERAELPAPATAQRDGLLSAADKAKIDSLSSMDVEECFAALGDLAREGDAPDDGQQYVRKNRSWAVLQTPPSAGTSGGSGSGGGIIGDIRLLPFRADSLPFGWHFCNGDRFPLASAQGQVLFALPESFKTDWGITVAGGAISLPRLFDPATGAGLFLRSVDGDARLPGSAQDDAIRNITASFSLNALAGIVLVNPTNKNPSALTGAFAARSAPMKSYAMGTASSGANSTADLLFDASRAVPTAEENRPVNIGMTPAIYLGI